MTGTLPFVIADELLFEFTHPSALEFDQDFVAVQTMHAPCAIFYMLNGVAD